MRLNSKGYYAMFYRWFGDGSLPEDFCTFFWGLVLRGFVVLGVGSMSIFLLISLVIWTVRFILAHKKINADLCRLRRDIRSADMAIELQAEAQI